MSIGDEIQNGLDIERHKLNGSLLSLFLPPHLEKGVST